MASQSDYSDTPSKSRKKSAARFSNLHVKPQTVERSKFYEDLVEEMRRKMCCHKKRESLFSSSSGFLNYRGILNWAVVVLILTHAYMVLENLITYGLLVDPVQMIAFALSDPNTWPGSYLIIVSNVYIFVALHIERSLSAWDQQWFCISSCTVSYDENNTDGSNIQEMVIFPDNLTIKDLYYFLFAPTLCYQMNFPRSSKIRLRFLLRRLVEMSIFDPQTKRKMAQVIATAQESGMNQTYATYSNTKSASHLMTRFWDLYEDESAAVDRPMSRFSSGASNFRVASIDEIATASPDRKAGEMAEDYLLTIGLECHLDLAFAGPDAKGEEGEQNFDWNIFLIHLFIGLIQQWVLPVTRNSMQPFVEMKLTTVIHQLMLLAIPNHFMWLILFHGFFHSTLNFIAELLRFGDRRFYRDWWNSETLTYFWSNSNIILHKWYLRHVYRPLIEKGYSKWEAQTSVFILSALYHEYMIAAPLQMFRFWLFMEMMVQVPTAWFLSKFVRGFYGNAIVWVCIILGPPLVVYMYIHDYYMLQGLKANEQN
ncbi:diacylglycerol O-acyltransferase 1-like [Scyliorhinus torazame]|uniref:diacylglycerol O-acyltransferase 1-like n=1 Tax=Scyliorhinus torazame TaxID=75743 RepID=UPI003B5CB2CD